MTYPPTAVGNQYEVIEFSTVADLNTELNNPRYVSGGNSPGNLEWNVGMTVYTGGGSTYALQYSIGTIALA